MGDIKLVKMNKIKRDMAAKTIPLYFHVYPNIRLIIFKKLPPFRNFV